VLQGLSHVNIVGFLESVVDETTGTVALVMDFYPLDLWSYIEETGVHKNSGLRSVNSSYVMLQW